MLYPCPYVLYSAFLVHKFGVVCSSAQTKFGMFAVHSVMADCTSNFQPNGKA
jgi:hypothetical protein